MPVLWGAPAGSSSRSWIQHEVEEGAPVVTAPLSRPAQETACNYNTRPGLLKSLLFHGLVILLGLTPWLSEHVGFYMELRNTSAEHSRVGKSTL